MIGRSWSYFWVRRLNDPWWPPIDCSYSLSVTPCRRGGQPEQHFSLSERWRYLLEQDCPYASCSAASLLPLKHKVSGWRGVQVIIMCDILKLELIRVKLFSCLNGLVDQAAYRLSSNVVRWHSQGYVVRGGWKLNCRASLSRSAAVSHTLAHQIRHLCRPVAR